jgi:hypothetical protein
MVLRKALAQKQQNQCGLQFWGMPSAGSSINLALCRSLYRRLPDGVASVVEKNGLSLDARANFLWVYREA